VPTSLFVDPPVQSPWESAFTVGKLTHCRQL